MVDSSELAMSAAPQAAENSETISAACPLKDFSPEAHQYIHALEQRIAALESNHASMAQRAKDFGKFLYQNPMTKMMLSAMPKDMQKRLEEFFNG